MPRTYSPIEKIRAELAWVNEPVDPNVCGCRHARCCERESHAIAKCPRSPTRTFWSFRREYYCDICIEYQFGGSKHHGYMTACLPFLSESSKGSIQSHTFSYL